MTIEGRKAAGKFRRLIERYADAQVDDSWKGGGDPDDIPRIEKRLEKTAKQVEAELMRLCELAYPGTEGK